MNIKEVRLEELDPQRFIKEKVEEIRSIVGENYAINALSGGVDSSTVTMLGHLALGEKLRTYFIDNGLMRENEPEQVIALFKELGVNVILVDAKEKFFNALKGIKDPEEKRETITRVFYREVFGKIVKESGIKFLLQGTNYTDIEETVAGIKRQHNVLEQLGIDTEKEFGYKVIEPLIQLRKPAIRKIAEALGLPKSVYERMPFPGPALAARIIGEVTPERVKIVRKCTSIVEQELKDIKAFQYLAILHEDKVTGIIEGKRKLGFQVEIRCWESLDAKTASPTRLPYDILEKIAERITSEVKDVVSVTYNITRKPPSTIEAV
ncbi:MAG: ExsB family transcriptional regulator [Nitrososphaeria archaeon]|nr:ExsB family transcriptional regulator [Nitrososphaeria archaeon]